MPRALSCDASFHTADPDPLKVVLHDDLLASQCLCPLQRGSQNRGALSAFLAGPSSSSLGQEVTSGHVALRSFSDTHDRDNAAFSSFLADLGPVAKPPASKTSFLIDPADDRTVVAATIASFFFPKLMSPILIALMKFRMMMGLGPPSLSGMAMRGVQKFKGMPKLFTYPPQMTDPWFDPPYPLPPRDAIYWAPKYLGGGACPDWVPKDFCGHADESKDDQAAKDAANAPPPEPVPTPDPALAASDPKTEGIPGGHHALMEQQLQDSGKLDGLEEPPKGGDEGAAPGPKPKKPPRSPRFFPGPARKAIEIAEPDTSPPRKDPTVNKDMHQPPPDLMKPDDLQDAVGQSGV